MVGKICTLPRPLFGGAGLRSRTLPTGFRLADPQPTVATRRAVGAFMGTKLRRRRSPAARMDPMVSDDDRMWSCPECGRRFASRGQTHSCGSLGSLEDHFQHTSPAVRATFDRFRVVVEACGPVEVLPQKTRIAFHARMSFAVLVPRREWLSGHLVLASVVDDPHFTRITTYSPQNHVHDFRLAAPDDIDADMEHCIAKAYDVGQQRRHRHRG